MSKYIVTKGRLVDLEADSRNLLSGTMSRILAGARKSGLRQAQESIYNDKICLRIKTQQLNASLIHQDSLEYNFKRLKLSLQKYAKKPYLSLERTNLREQSLKKEKGLERIIFIDRKYNTELAIKRAVLSEVDEINTIKSKNRSFLKQRMTCPLIQQADRSLSKFKRQDKMLNQNPVVKDEKKRLHKKKKTNIFRK